MTPEEDKTSYIAYYNTAVTLSAIAAPLIGVGLLGMMSFRAAFLVTAGIRVAGSLCYYALYRADTFRGTPWSFRGTPWSFRGTPWSFRGTPWSSRGGRVAR